MVAKPRSKISICCVLNSSCGQSALYTECRDARYERETYAKFMAKRFETNRRMAQLGIGAWYGAFLEGQLVGDLGLFIENGIGRFQGVETHPEHRRRGICGTLVHHVATRAFSKLSAKTLVMLADEEYHAAKI